MNARWPSTPVSVLTPVTPGLELDLELYLKSLTPDESPFRALDSAHTARMVVVGQIKHLVGMPRIRRPLRMRYLLFTAVSNSPPAEFLHEVQRCGPFLDQTWGRCVGYPGHDDPVALHDYLVRNMIPPAQTYAAYDATVADIRTALELRRQHAQLAVRSQGVADSEQLRQMFLRQFGEGTS